MGFQSFETTQAIGKRTAKEDCISSQKLKNWPDCQNVKALKDRNDYRLRVGRYRVFFEVLISLKIVKIVEVKKRDDRTY